MSVSKVHSDVVWPHFDTLYFRDFGDIDAMLKSRFTVAECEIVSKNNVYPIRNIPLHNSPLVPLYVRRAFVFLRRRPHALNFAFDAPIPLAESAPLLPTPLLDDSATDPLGLESVDALIGGDDTSRIGFVSRLLGSAFRTPTPAPDEPLLCDAWLDASSPQQQPQFDVDRDVLDNELFQQQSLFGDEFYDVASNASALTRATTAKSRHHDSSAPPAPSLLDSAFRFVVTCEKLVFDIGPVEPLFGSAALYDGERKQRLSETFFFDFNGDNLAQLFNFENEALRSRDKAGLFRVGSPSNTTILVVRIERLLRGDIENDLPTYACKAKDLQAAKNAFAQDTRKLSARGSRLQPLAWAATELFGDDGKWLGGRRVTMDLMAVSNNQCSDQWVLDKGLRSAAKRVAVGRLTLALRRLAPLVDASSVTLADHAPAGDGLPPMTVLGPHDEQYVLDTAGGCAVPRAVADVKRVPDFTCREVQSLEAPMLPPTRFSDFLYVYCESVVLKQDANVMVEVSLSVGDTTVERAFWQRNEAGEHRYSQFGTTSVVYRSRQPAWYDELKVRLPPVVTTAHQLRFTFFHVVPASKLREKSSWVGVSQKASKERVVLGTAYLPLIQLVPAPKVANNDDDLDDATRFATLRRPATLSPRQSTTPRDAHPLDVHQHEGSPNNSPRAPGSVVDDGESDDEQSATAAPTPTLSASGVASTTAANAAAATAEHNAAIAAAILAESIDGGDNHDATPTDDSTTPPPPPHPASTAAILAAATEDDDSSKELSPDVRVAALLDNEATGGDGHLMRRFLPDGPHVLPVQAVRWIDNKRNVFVVRTQLVSTVRTQDDALSTFFHTLAPDSASVRTAVTALFQARPTSLITFFPVIAGHLVSLVCSAGRTVAINAINSLRALLDRIHTLSPRAAREGAESYVQRAFRLQKANGPGNSSHNVLAVPRDAHVALVHRWLSFRRKRQRAQPETTAANEYPEHESFFVDMILRSLAMAHSQSPATGFDGATSPRAHLRRPVPPQFLGDLLALLTSFFDAAIGPGRTLRLVTSTTGQLAALLLPSQFIQLVHRLVRYVARSPSGLGLSYGFELCTSLLSSPHVLPFDCSATPLSQADCGDDDGAGGSTIAVDGEYAERSSASVHGISSLLVSLVRRVLCDDLAAGITRRAALIAVRDAICSLERIDLDAGAAVVAADDPSTLSARNSSSASSTRKQQQQQPQQAQQPQITPRRLMNRSRLLRSHLLGAYVSLLGAVTRMHSASVLASRRPPERYELMLACVAVLRAAPPTTVFDEWLLRVDVPTRRSFVRLLCKFGRLVRCAAPSVRAEVYTVCVRTLCQLMVRMDVSGVNRPSATDIVDQAAADVLDGVLSLANMALHVAGGRRFIAALVVTALRVPRMRAALFPRALGDVEVPAAEVLAALLLRMCCGETEKRSPAATAHGNATLPKLPSDDAALQLGDVALSDAQLGRTLLVITLRVDGGGASGQLATHLARAGAFACANGGDARQLLSSLMRLAGVDVGRWGPTLAPTLDALSRAAAAQVPQIALAGRRHALAESLLTLAANSLTTAPGAAFVWFETLARTHVASAAGLAEEVAHVRLLAAALVASHMRKEGRLENLLALLLERAFAHASAAARRVYASASEAPAPANPKAAASPFALWQHTGLLRLLEGATQSLAQAGASRACTELCHALAHAAMSARRLRSLAHIHEIAAGATRELLRRSGVELETSLLFLVRFRGAKYSDPAACATLVGHDFVYRQALAGFSTTEEVALRLQTRIIAECRASGPQEPQVLDQLPPTHDGNKLLVVVEPLFPVFGRRAADGVRMAATDNGIVLRGEATTVYVRWRHAFPGPLARSRVIATTVTLDESTISQSRPLTEQERAADAKDTEGIFRCGVVDDPQEGAFTVTDASTAPPEKKQQLQREEIEDEDVAMQYFAQQRQVATMHSAFQILRKRVQTALDQVKLNS